MVGFDPNSVEDLGKPPPKHPKPEIAVNPLVTALDDFCPLIIDNFTDFDSIDDWIVENDPIEMWIEGKKPCCTDGSEANRSVECEDTYHSAAPPQPFACGAHVAAYSSAGLVKLESFGSQIEEGMDKVSSVQISIKSENMEVMDEKESDGCVAVQSVTKETETGDGNPFVEAAGLVKLGSFGSQIEEGMEKVSSVADSESSVQVCNKSENMEVMDDKESDGCVAVVQNVTEEAETGDGNTFVEAAGLVRLGSFGSQIEEGMEKVSLVGASESSVQISIKSENMEELDEKESDGCVDAVQSVTGESEVVSGEMGFKVSSETKLAKPEENNGVSDSKNGELIDGDDSDSSSESESEVSSTSSSSSSSSCSEEEEEEKEEEGEEEDEIDMGIIGEMEEGEIRDFEVDGIICDSDDEENGGVMRGPIKSKNEIQILPPVPPVDVALGHQQQTLPVGVISSIMGTKVIVEGLEKHNPLNEGSILWITETRLPLGLVDEIFGPVKNPYYVVRYNSDKEVPAGIQTGTSVSFVEDFADHVLSEKNLYKKGYDASGDNDEEVSDEYEFSDDEKEAEYRRMQRMAKRGADDHKRGNRDFIDRKKAQQKGEFQKKTLPPVPPGPQHPPSGGQPPGIRNQPRTPSIAAPVGCGGYAFSHGPSGTASMSTFPSISQVEQAAYCMPQHLLALNNGVWTNGMPSQQQQHAVFPNGYPVNGPPSQQQNMPLPCGQPFQQLNPLFVNIPNGMPVQQQFNPSQMLLPSVALPFGQPNFTPRPLSTPWTGIIGHPGFSHTTFGMDFDSRLGYSSMNCGEQGALFSGYPSMNSGEQGAQSSGLCNEQSNGMQPPAVTRGSFASPRCYSPMNSGDQRAQSSGLCNEQSNGMQPPAVTRGNLAAPQQFHQGVQSSGLCNEQSNRMQLPAVTQGNFAAPQQFHQGAFSTRGRKPYRRGGGNFAGGRGQRRSG